MTIITSILTPRSPISKIPRLGPAFSSKLGRLGVETIFDLLFYFPWRYEDLSTITPLSNIRIGEHQTIRAKVELLANKRSPRKRMTITEAMLSDGTGQLKAIWFQQPYLKNVLTPGKEFLFSGKVQSDRYGLYLSNPTYEVTKREQLHVGRIVPIYALTTGLTQKQLRFFLSQTLHAISQIDDWLPDEIRSRHSLIGIQQALREIHFPKTHASLETARRRLKFDELFFLQLKSQSILKLRKSLRAPKIPFQLEPIKQFLSRLPFELTADQKKTAWKILQNLEEETPMNRLLEGDVGSGKTVVAALALLQCAKHHFQGAVFAPTEVLAEQHFRTFQQLFSNTSVRIALLTQNLFKLFPEDPAWVKASKTLQRKMLTEHLLLHNVDVVIGTHALIEKDVRFANLGLAVIDEQHRFGVRQRKSLSEKSRNPSLQPHLLSMTATPIPRSLALTIYGDLDLSIIHEKPKGRKTVITSLVTEREQKSAYNFVDALLEKDQQAFVICPLISDSELWDARSVEEEAKELEEHTLPHRRIGVLHGKLKSEQKEKILKDFIERRLDVLVATSVIEVGIDIPNATVMIIKDAERFGLAQLHQFRGRVGRSDRQSYCFVFSNSFFPDTRERLRAFAETNDGFLLAEKDLQLRGPGEVYGTAQSGLPKLSIATLGDHEIIAMAQTEAKSLLSAHPDLSPYPRLKNHLDHWLKEVHFE